MHGLRESTPPWEGLAHVFVHIDSYPQGRVPPKTGPYNPDTAEAYDWQVGVDEC